MRLGRAVGGAIALLVIGLAASTGAALALEPEDLYGRWEAEREGTIAVTFHPDGTATASEGGESFAMTWSLDRTATPALLTLLVDDDRLHALVWSDAPGSFSMTEPREDPPERDAAGLETVTFHRVGPPPGGEEPAGIYERLGLDLSTPRLTAESFAGALARHDGLLIHFLLDPRARQAFLRALQRLDTNGLLALIGGDPEDAAAADGLLDAIEPYMAEESTNAANGLLAVDSFALTAALFRYAADHELTPVPLTGEADFSGEPSFHEDDPELVRADMPVLSADGATVRLHLLQSPGGLWRVLGATYGPADNPVTWLLTRP